MNPASRRRRRRKIIRQGLVVVVIVLGMLLVFIKAKPFDSNMHYALMSDLRELQSRDAELGEAVLQHHYQLFHNYDAVVFIMGRMQELASALEGYHAAGLLPDTPQIRDCIAGLQSEVGKKAEALEKFKSDNAVSKTALIYLPSTVSQVLGKLPANSSYGDLFENLLRDALLMVVNQGSESGILLSQDIDRVRQVIPHLPLPVRKTATLASRHAQSILLNESGMPDLLSQLSLKGDRRLGSDLESLYQDYYRDTQSTATYYRLLLYFGTMGLLGYAVVIYFREKERRQQLRIAATTFETNESIMIIDPQRRIQRVNRAFTRLTGYTADEVIGGTSDILKSARHDESFFRSRWEVLKREGYWQGEVWNRHKSGRVHPVWLTTTAVTDADGDVTHYVSIVTDISERKMAEEQIHQLAFYDSLTRLPNRRLLIDRLNHSMASGTRSIDHGAILFIDLDNFKTINDTKGHDVGDLLLIETAQRLQNCIRGGDTVARLGGDEFVVMLEGLGADTEQAASQARIAGEKIREALGQLYMLGDFEYHSSCSIGISLFRGREISVEDLLKRSDTAMYEAKSSGRNTIRFFDPSMQATLEERARLENDLRNAIAQKQFALYYQIQVDNHGQPVGAEALLRWNHPARGMVMPDEFINLAEENGLILPIGQWVLETACNQIKSWASQPHRGGLQVSVNVSARQFHQQGFVEQVARVIADTGADPARLKIELTESVVLDDIADTAEKMRELRKIGVGFSMDDFGTGYSSLAYLTQLPIQQLKVDQSFVRNISAKSTDAAIVQTIVGMAKNLGIEVVAEGVENMAQQEFLERAGCLIYQGYLFSLPLPVEEFENEVSRRQTPAQRG